MSRSSLVSSSWPKAVYVVIETLHKGGYEAYLVGGCVRDALLHRPVSDYDIATNALPQAVQGLFPRTVATGLKHGTVTVLVEGVGIEVTTYRIDTQYSDGRRPDAVIFTPSLIADLARRDFTVNAMAMSLDGTLIDPYGGKRDLNDGCIRAVGDPLQRFGEDGLRILRAFRFAAQLGFVIEPRTLAAMSVRSELLRSLSRERIGQELFKMAQHRWWLVSGYLGEGPWLLELPDPLSRLRSGHICASSWNSEGPLLETVQDHFATTAQDCVAVMSAVWLYLSDAEAGDAKRLATALAWPNSLGRRIVAIYEAMRQDPLHFSRQAWREALFTEDPWSLQVACAILDWSEATSKSPSERHAQTRGQLFAEYIRQQPIHSLRDLQLSGADLVELGFLGPAIGRCLQVLVNDVLSGEVLNERAVLFERAKQYAQEGF